MKKKITEKEVRQMRERSDIFYDLEGPISSQDNAQAVCKKYVKDGRKVFSVISHYDDLLTLVNKEGYEPGDTLALIMPFLIEARVTKADIQAISAEAGLVQGICEFFRELREEGCTVWIISTSYKVHAFSIAEKVGVPQAWVYCTELPLSKIKKNTSVADLSLVGAIRKKIVELYRDDLESGANDEAILKLLYPFYWEVLPRTKFGRAIAEVKVMGGRRKVFALEQALHDSGRLHLCDTMVVADSITDFRMAQAVEAAGGIALAWNANWYLLPYASCGVAAVDARAVRPLFNAWREGGRTAVREFIESAPKPEDLEAGPYYHWLAGSVEGFTKNIVLPIHQKLRRTCRGKEVAKLG